MYHNNWVDHARTLAKANPWPVAGGAFVLVLVVLFALWKAVGAARRALKGHAVTALVTLAAILATVVQATGMWKFFADTMHLPLGLRIFLFAFMEIALLAFGIRARENVRADRPAGFDGAMVWALAIASGIMSSTDASSGQEVLMRLLVPIVVACLWERDLLAARIAARGEGRTSETVRWRMSLAALGVKLGLADAADQTIAGKDANRRIDRYVRAAHTASRVRGETGWFATRTKRRETRAHSRLMRHARLHADPTALMEQLGTLAFTDALTLLGVTRAEDELAAAKAEAEQKAIEASSIADTADQRVKRIQAEARAWIADEREKATVSVAAAEAERTKLAAELEDLRGELRSTGYQAAGLDSRLKDLRDAVAVERAGRQSAEANLQSETVLRNQIRAQLEETKAKAQSRIAELEDHLDQLRAAAAAVVPAARNGSPALTLASSRSSTVTAAVDQHPETPPIFIGVPKEGTKKAAFIAYADALVESGDLRILDEDRRIRMDAAIRLDTEHGLGLGRQSIQKYVAAYYQDHVPGARPVDEDYVVNGWGDEVV